MTRVALIDIPFRQRTRSTQFLYDLLIEAGATVDEVHWLPSHGLDGLVRAVKAADVAVLVQVEILAPLCQHLGVPAVSVPMYDAVANHADEYWEFVSSASTACFSLSLHLRLRGLGHESQHHKYFPQPAREPRDFSGGLHGFLWERRPVEALDWPTVNHFFGPNLSSMHVHVAADPGYVSSKLPKGKGELPYTLSTSKWRRDPLEYRRALDRSNVYFAPRRTEGIGMSYLEAFGQGMCVVAFDDSTHNEYISDGLTGVLLPGDLDHFHSAGVLDRAPEMGVEAWYSAVAGRKAWVEQGGPALVRQIMNPPAAKVPALDWNTVSEVVMAWNDPARFYPLLRAAVLRNGGFGATAANGHLSTSFACVQHIEGGKLDDESVALRVGDRVDLHLGLDGEGASAVVLRLRVDVGTPSVRLTCGDLTIERAIGDRQSLIIPIPNLAGRDSFVLSVDALGPHVHIVDVLMVTTENLNRAVAADIDMGDVGNRYRGSSREVLLDWMVGSRQQPYVRDAREQDDLCSAFEEWAIAQHLEGALLPAGLLTVLADGSWQGAREAHEDSALPRSKAFDAVVGHRMASDPDFAERYSTDDWQRSAWFYLHGIGEHRMGRLIGDAERSFLLTPGGNGDSPLEWLVSKWRGVPILGDLRDLREDHPGLSILLPG